MCVCVRFDGSQQTHRARSSVRHQITELAARKKLFGKMSKTPGTIHSFAHPEIAASFGKAHSPPVAGHVRLPDWVHRFLARPFNLRRASFLFIFHAIRPLHGPQTTSIRSKITHINVWTSAARTLHLWDEHGQKVSAKYEYKFQFITHLITEQWTTGRVSVDDAVCAPTRMQLTKSI